MNSGTTLATSSLVVASLYAQNPLAYHLSTGGRVCGYERPQEFSNTIENWESGSKTEQNNYIHSVNKI